MATHDPMQDTPKGARLVFGIFMILFYIAVGLLFILYRPALIYTDALSCVVGGILIAYGFFRAYRLYKA